MTYRSVDTILSDPFASMIILVLACVVVAAAGAAGALRRPIDRQPGLAFRPELCTVYSSHYHPDEETIMATPIPAQPFMPTYAPAKPPKSLTTAYLLWLFLGGLGVHQFYLGNTGRGLLRLFTLGGLGILLLIDLFTMPDQVAMANAKARLR